MTAPNNNALNERTIALRIEDENMAMAPEFLPGDIVVVDPDAELRPGDIVVAALDSDAGTVLRKYLPLDTGVFELVPLNDEYLTLVVGAELLGRIIGRVVEHRRQLLRGERAATAAQ